MDLTRSWTKKQVYDITDMLDYFWHYLVLYMTLTYKVRIFNFVLIVLGQYNTYDLMDMSDEFDLAFI